MARGVRWYLVGSGILGLLGSLAGCSGGYFFAEREPWRHEAEVQCINSGTVREGAGIVRVKAIRGPGACGADFPLRVSELGEGATTLGYSDDLRPPSSIPGASAQPRGPAAAPPPYETRAPAYPSYPSRSAQPPSRVLPEYRSTGDAEGPISLNPNG